MLTSIMIYAVVIGYLGLTMYLANQEELTGEQSGSVRFLLSTGAISLLFLGVYMLMMALTQDRLLELATEQPDVIVPQISTAAALIAFVLSGLAGLASLSVINSSGSRHALSRLVGSWGYYNPNSIVHTTAVVLSLLLLTVNSVLFILEGGTVGMAESIEEGVPIGLPVFQAFLQVAAAFLGVGYAIRRSMPQALQRLGLRWPTSEDLRWGIGGGFGLFGIVILYGILLMILIALGLLSTDQAQEQGRAAESLAQAFATLPLAILLSASASIGEEIFFRGALQPVFGNILTSIFFALLHTQVLLSLGVFLLFFVSLGLGWLRRRFSTTTAIIAHFTYNFIQLTLLMLAASTGAV